MTRMPSFSYNGHTYEIVASALTWEQAGAEALRRGGYLAIISTAEENLAICQHAAFLLGRAVAGEAELLTLATAPESRRLGLGRKLVARFLYQARLRAAETAFLEVAADNAPARALYLASGFTESGRRKNYYQNPQGGRIDALVMRRAIL